MNSRNSSNLRRRLLAIGHDGARRAEAAKPRFMALLLAAFMVTLSLSCLAATHAAYMGKEVRREFRTPVPQEQQPHRKEATLWLVGSDSLQDERRFSVVYIDPRTANAPLPPGVDRWPGPGEVLLSPALRAAGTDEGIERRYGKLVGTIGPEGLEDPGEWLAYVHPPRGMSAERPTVSVVGFGPGTGRLAEGLEPGSGRFDDKPEWMFQALVAGLLLLPSATLLFVAARTGAYARDRRTALVAVLGGRRSDRALIAVGEAWRPVALGAIAAAPLIVAAMLADLHVPYTDYLLSSADLRRYGWLAALAPMGAAAIALSIVVLADQLPRHRSGTRPLSARSSRWQPRFAALCPLMILLAVHGPELAGSDTGLRMEIFWIGIAATALTLPAAVAAGTAALGRLLERTGRTRGWAATMVSGRRLSVHSGATVRLITGIIVALIVFMQSVAWQALFGTQWAALEEALSRVDRRVVEIGPKGQVAAGDVTAFLQQLPDNSEAVLLTTTSVRGDRPITLRGSCAALKHLDLPCPARQARLDRMPEDPRVEQLIRWNSQGGTSLQVARSGLTTIAKRTAERGEDAVLAVVSTDGSAPSVAALKRLSYKTFPRGAQVRTPGEEWLTAAIPNRDQGRWAVLFGLIGIGVLVAAAGLSAMAEFLRHGRALAPLSVLTGGYRVFRSGAGWSVLAPLAMAGLAGSLVAAWLTRPVSRPGASYYVPVGLLGSTIAVVLVLAFAMWLWSARVAESQARNWRP